MTWPGPHLGPWCGSWGFLYPGGLPARWWLAVGGCAVATCGERPHFPIHAMQYICHGGALVSLPPCTPRAKLCPFYSGSTRFSVYLGLGQPHTLKLQILEHYSGVIYKSPWYGHKTASNFECGTTPHNETGVPKLTGIHNVPDTHRIHWISIGLQCDPTHNPLMFTPTHHCPTKQSVPKWTLKLD